jgi:hypothetical protein
MNPPSSNPKDLLRQADPTDAALIAASISSKMTEKVMVKDWG